jgi:hypothetical protein
MQVGSMPAQDGFWLVINKGIGPRSGQSYGLVIHQLCEWNAKSIIRPVG